jgi:16S rRNA (guanine(966)-N(2))-methyltransferase RsmD
MFAPNLVVMKQRGILCQRISIEQAENTWSIDLRIIAGKFRGRRLKSPPGAQTRPTSDRLRETLFNILAPRIEGARLLDLCAGTGAIGLEALSRGAAHVTFVDQSRKMCGLIGANLDSLEVASDDREVVVAEVFDYLRRHLRKSGLAFDLIFFDPPYATDYDVMLNSLGEHASQILSVDGIVIVEHHKKKILSEQFKTLVRYRELKQGDSILSFYRIA